MATNGNIAVSTDLGFSPIQTVFAPNVSIIANTTPVTYESAIVLFSANIPRAIGDGYTNLATFTPFIPNVSIIANTTPSAYESAIILFSANIPRAIGDDYTNLAKLTPSASITYAISDGLPIVPGTTSSQQYWI